MSTPSATNPSGCAFKHEIPADRGAGEFVKTGACATCRLDRRCYGLRRGYAELHGTDELRPVE